MSDCMVFPNTWEEFEQGYGFEDKKEIYTNGSRLIQSFRVKQWLDHIAEPERTAKVVRVDMPSVHNKVYKCQHCGQYTHRTSWSSPVNYCTNCGARLEWE